MNFIFKSIIDFVLPARCSISGQIVDLQGTVAPESWKKLHFIAAPYCECCGLPFEFAPPEEGGGYLCGSCIKEKKDYEKCRAALVYDDISRDVVLAFKHGDQTHLIVSILPWLKQAGREILDLADFITPVPLHRFRLLKRRYNQASLLSAALARAVKKPCVPDALFRIRQTPPQGHKSAGERHENVRGAFRLNPAHQNKIQGARILLIDDVYTTGATVEACAKVLKKAGAAEVYVLCIARVVRPDRG